MSIVFSHINLTEQFCCGILKQRSERRYGNKKQTYVERANIALNYYSKAGIILTDDEKKRIEVVDFGLGCVEEIGLQILTYINTDRVCALV